MKFFGMTLLLLSIACSAAPKKNIEFQDQGQSITLQHVVGDLGIPWGFDFLSADEILVTIKSGKMYRINLNTKKPVAVTGLPKMEKVGQGGLMDVKLHPQFKKNSWVYYTYVDEYQKGEGTLLARSKLSGNELKETQILFRSTPPGSGGRHFGSRIVFDSSGYVYFSVGDRGDRDYAQKLNYPNGKIFRLHDDGRVPKDNPFVGQKSAIGAIWSYGHRNPQGMAVHPSTGEVWAQEHGPRGGDEINRIVKGGNYGWPVITYGKEYWGPSIGTTHKKGMLQPVKYYVPSIAPSGLMIYSGKVFKAWSNDFFSGSLKLTHLNRLKIENNKAGQEMRLLKDHSFRIRNVKEGPRGHIYFSTDSGSIYRLIPKVK